MSIVNIAAGGYKLVTTATSIFGPSEAFKSRQAVRDTYWKEAARVFGEFKQSLPAELQSELEARRPSFLVPQATGTKEDLARLYETEQEFRNRARSVTPGPSVALAGVNLPIMWIAVAGAVALGFWYLTNKGG